MVSFVPVKDMSSALLPEEPFTEMVELKTQDQYVLSNLSNYVLSKFEEARRAKVGIEERLIDCLQRFKSEYSPQKLQEIKSIDAPPIYIPLTSIKVRALTAWLVDVLFQTPDLPYDITPTPIPELPLEVQHALARRVYDTIMPMVELLPFNELQSMALDAKNLAEKEIKIEIDKWSKKLAEGFKKKLDDVFIEGGLPEALSAMCVDIAIFPTAIIKGGILRKEKGYVRTKYGLEPKNKVIYTFNRVSPFNAYPAPYSSGFENYFIEVVPLLPNDLYDMIGMPGYNSKILTEVLDRYEHGYKFHHMNYGLDKEALEGNEFASSSDYEYIDVLEFWGPVKGSLLKDFGISVPSSNAYYEATVWVIEDYVIKAVLNENPLGLKPYAKASFIDIPDSFWGQALPEVLAPIQDSVNAFARSVVVNAAMSSGPMVERNIDRVDPSQPKMIIPWHMYDAHDSALNSAPAYRFFQPQLTADRLSTVMAYYLKLADETCGIPSYAHGDITVGGAGRALADYELVLTETGAKPISSIEVGDKVAGTDGKFYEVLGVYPQKGKRLIYRVHFSNGFTIDCDADHLWTVSSKPSRKSSWQTLTLAELLNKGIFRQDNGRKSKGLRPKWAVSKIKPVQFPKREVKIDPYTLGVILGDGDNRGRIHLNTEDSEHIISQLAYSVGKPSYNSAKTAVSYTVKGVKKWLRFYGLGDTTAPDKFIPEDYLFNTVDVRLALLRGLMDTDGYTSEGRVFLSSSSRKLIEQVKFLVISLGGWAGTITEYPEGEGEIKGRTIHRKKNYRLYFSLSENVFTLPRKKEAVKGGKRPTWFVYIRGIELLGEGTTTCIKVSSPDHLFLCANLIPTHNTATGLSMLTNNATRGIKAVLRNIDKGIIEPIVKRQYYTLIKEANVTDIPDLKIRTKGSISLSEREMEATRALEFLRVVSNPLDQNLVPLEGRRYLLTSAAKATGFDPDRIFGYEADLQQMLRPLIEETQAQFAQQQSPINVPQNKAVQLGMGVSNYVNENGRVAI